MVKAFFLDFYGTVVHEDGEIIKKITRIIYETGTADHPAEIGAFWWEAFQNLFLNAYGARFETQRALEYQSLKSTVDRFRSTADARALSGEMFAYWRKPPIFEDAKAFFAACPLPVYLVSNIDTADIHSAVAYHRLSPAGIFTSEEARAYKPRQEIFRLALDSAGLSPDEVIHVGDSVSGDYQGASRLGIRALWLNRFQKEAPEGVKSAGGLMEALEVSAKDRFID